MVKQYIERSFKRLSSLSPQAAIAGALIIVVVGSGLALLLTRGGSEANANPALQPYAARLDRVDGSVGIARADDRDQELDWAEANVNTPVTVGDRIYTRDYAHASIALSGQNYVRLNPATSLDVLALEDRRTQFALRSGSALFDVGALPAGELFEVATPCGAVDFKEPGLYQIGMDGGNAIISVLNGLAQVVGMEGSGFISKGQVFTLTGATAAEALASTLSSDTAGEIVDDYYRYRYPRVYNGRYRSYDAYLDDPSYYDPYRTSVSYQYLPADIPGLYDLDYYGDWVDLNDYGHCWAPRVTAGWAPFRSGYWDLDDLWGPSWVSSEPWGWAPYHYGRWAFINQRWFWVPVEVRTRPVYCPATVAFIPLANQIAWVPLGPGEVYVPRYYDNFSPRYLASADVVRVVTVQNTFVNFNAPGAVTVVPVGALESVIDPRVITPVDVAVVGRSRAVLDPFSVAEVRELATRRDGHRRIKFERHEQEALNTTVVASATPEALPARGDFAKRFRVEAVPEKRRENKLNINETAQVTSSRRPDGLPQPLVQSQRMNELASRAEQGDKAARREMRQLMREEQRTKPSRSQPAAQPPAVQQQAQQEQTRQQIKQQRRAERQQQSAGAPGQQAAQAQQRQQMKQQRRLERQQQSAAAAQQQQQVRRQQQKQMRQQEQLRQQQMRQQKSAQPPARRKPPEVSFQQRQTQVQRIQRAQQGIARQAQIERRQEQQRAQPRVDRRQAMMQQQAARAQAAQRQAMMQQQAARAEAAQRQAMMQQPAARAQAQRQAVMQQQAARAQAAQRQAVMQQQAARAQAAPRQAVMQQQAARAQAAQRQAASPSRQRAQEHVVSPGRQDAPRKAEKAQRKPQ